MSTALRSLASSIWHGSRLQCYRRPSSELRDIVGQLPSSRIEKRYFSYRQRRQNDVANLQRFMGTWLIPEPSDFRPSDFIKQLPVLELPGQRFQRCALFLVTPSLAHLLDGQHPFLDDCMKHIFQRFEQIKDGAVVQYRSLGVVVDAVPSTNLTQSPARASSPTSYPIPSEGISVLICPSTDVMPISSEEYRLAPGTLIFQLDVRTRHVSPKFTQVQIPAATTFFINGQQNTFIRRTWQFNGGSGLGLSEVKTVDPPLSNLKILTTRTERNIHIPPLPLYRLTQPRVVASSMGNIIRSLYSGDDETEIPASSELEKAVPQYLDSLQQKSQDGKFEVYAMVRPRQLGSRLRWKVNAVGADIRNGWRLHRVTSGGGGWGSKQGLLSLDPAVDFSSESRNSIEAFDQKYVELDQPHEVVKPPKRFLDLSLQTPPKVQEEDAPELNKSPVSDGQIAPQGCLVKFYATYYVPSQGVSGGGEHEVDSERALLPSDDKSTAGGTSDAHHVTLGTIPPRDQPVSATSTTQSTEGTVTFLPGRFGMLSESGMNLSISQKSGDGSTSLEPLTQSRLDCPYLRIESSTEDLETLEKNRHSKPTGVRDTYPVSHTDNEERGEGQDYEDDVADQETQERAFATSEMSKSNSNDTLATRKSTEQDVQKTSSHRKTIETPVSRGEGYNEHGSPQLKFFGIRNVGTERDVQEPSPGLAVAETAASDRLGQEIQTPASRLRIRKIHPNDGLQKDAQESSSHLNVARVPTGDDRRRIVKHQVMTFASQQHLTLEPSEGTSGDADNSHAAQDTEEDGKIEKITPPLSGRQKRRKSRMDRSTFRKLYSDSPLLSESSWDDLDNSDAAQDTEENGTIEETTPPRSRRKKGRRRLIREHQSLSVRRHQGEHRFQRVSVPLTIQHDIQPYELI